MSSFLKSLKINSVENLNNLEFVSSLNKDEIISKLLFAVVSLEKDITSLKETISKYEVFVQDNQNFTDNHGKFLAWIDSIKMQSKELSEIVGDIASIQVRL